MIRVRIHYSKTAALRYTSNLDIHRIWERTLRRARLPLAYSQGFHPQPRLNQASPLPLGLTSRCELIDIWLTEESDLKKIGQDIQVAAPVGIDLLNIELAELQAPALQTQVVSAGYEALILDSMPQDELKGRVLSVLQADSLPRLLHEKRKYDLRPLILDLAVLVPNISGRAWVKMLLSASEGATGRADEVMAAMGINPHDTRIERVSLQLRSTEE